MMMMTIKSQKCAFFRADPPRGQAPPPGGPIKNQVDKWEIIY